jgi:hypothetical protein
MLGRAVELGTIPPVDLVILDLHRVRQRTHPRARVLVLRKTAMTPGDAAFGNASSTPVPSSAQFRDVRARSIGTSVETGPTPAWRGDAAHDAPL